jgi:hypothetical protein
MNLGLENRSPIGTVILLLITPTPWIILTAICELLKRNRDACARQLRSTNYDCVVHCRSGVFVGADGKAGCHSPTQQNQFAASG